MAETAIAGCGVYAIRHKPTGRCYVGGSINVRDRWKSHRHGLRRGHDNPKLRQASTKDGPAAFEFVLLEHATPSDLLEREQFWIDALDAVQSGFNIAPVAGSLLGFRHSEDTKSLLRDRGTGRKFEGRTMSVEGRQRLSAALKGRPGQPMSTEAKAKLAAFRRGYTGWNHAPETRAKIGRRGSANSQARLTEDDVRDIRARAANGERQIDIAAERGVSKAAINDIVRRKNWAHVE